MPAVADILDQVTSRRLPSLFDYHSVPAPWFTVSLLRLLSLLAASDRKYAVHLWFCFDSYFYHNLFVLTAVFPGGPGLADTGMFSFWILLVLKIVEVVVTTGAVRRTKLQSYRDRHHQRTITQHFYTRDALPLFQPTISDQWREVCHNH